MSRSGGLWLRGTAGMALCEESWYINGGEGRDVLGGVGKSWIDL